MDLEHSPIFTCGHDEFVTRTVYKCEGTSLETWLLCSSCRKDPAFDTPELILYEKSIRNVKNQS